jgi:hypothetical protein
MFVCLRRRRRRRRRREERRRQLWSSGGYINGRNSANLELLIDKTSSISDC